MRRLLTQSISNTTILSSVNKNKNQKILSEFEMVSQLAEGLKTEFKTDVYVREFTAGYGIADLVFAKSFLSNVNSIDRKPISNYYALVLYLGINGIEAFSAKEAKSITRSSLATTQKAISYLLQNGYIERSGSRHYTKSYVMEKPDLKLVAIEAKLSDWKQGILQARRYKSFTDESYLALLSKYAKNVDHKLLEAHDIGLILVDEENGQVEFKRRPVGHRPKHMSIAETSDYADELFLSSCSIKTA